MIDQAATKLEKMLLEDEGLRLHPYLDPLGRLTIGVGRNLDAGGITKEEAFVLLRNDIMEAVACAERYPWFAGLCAARQDAVVNMIFNLGATKFAGFGHMILDLSIGDFSAAATEMLDSTWAKQVGERASVLAGMIKTGEYPADL